MTEVHPNTQGLNSKAECNPAATGDFELNRSQTLDDGHRPLENGRQTPTKPALDSLRNQSFTMSSAALQNVNEERRGSVASTGSAEVPQTLFNSNENLDKKPDDYSTSRPESRSASRMGRINEGDMDKIEPKPRDYVPSASPTITPSPNNTFPSFKTDILEEPREVKTKPPVSPSSKITITKESVQEDRSNVKYLNLKTTPMDKSPVRSEGDNDSGVDESTQGNEQISNGDRTSRKTTSSGKSSRRVSATTPTKPTRSLSRTSNAPSIHSPDSAATTPGSVERKKLPMNKVQVGSAPSPNLKVVKSKIGSLQNTSYKPGGGNVKIENRKIEFKNVGSRIEAKNEYVPKGGDKKIQQQKLEWNATSKIGSLAYVSHKPKGGDKKIESVKLDFKEKAKSKVASKDNIKYVPGGGDVKIENKKIEIRVQSKVGSFENVKHKPGGGAKKIFDDKEYLKQMSAISNDQSLSGSQNSLGQASGSQGADENLNQEN